MIFSITKTWRAERVTVGEVLAGHHKYRYCDFIEDENEDPWPYNAEWFEEQHKSKFIFVLYDEDETSKMEME